MRVTSELTQLTWCLAWHLTNTVAFGSQVGRDSSIFPTTAGAYDVTYNGGTLDAFASKLRIPKPIAARAGWFP